MLGEKRRILVVDDNEAIHRDIESILKSSVSVIDDELMDFEEELFGSERQKSGHPIIDYEIDHAYQGEEAVTMVDEADKSQNPYSLIFMDVRMPPGIDGIQAIRRTWQINPHVEVVICTAYSDYSWEHIMENLGTTDKLLFMRKPFDATALKQTALTLTTKWKLQQESIHYTETLENEVNERTDELRELLADYKKMKDKAENATEAKSEFLANMSHEIRTPMNGIIAMNELLLETELTDEQKEYCDLAEQSAKTLLRIINDILDFSKIEARMMDFEEIPIELPKLIENATKMIAASAREKPIEIRYELAEDIPDGLLGDPTRIRQVLLNYGNNAVKFTEKGSICILAELLNENENELVIKFSVTDTGKGIAKEKIKVLFRPFSQADNSTTRKFGGTGLGLLICKQLAELMGGEVGVESEPGNGSMFWFTVKLKKKAGLSMEQDTMPEIQFQDADFSQDLKILVAEDNSINQVVTRRILEEEGCTLHIVENGIDAVEAATNNAYDLVMMDLHMPEMDGFQATGKIREYEKKTGNRIPIIALTASSLSDEKVKCLQAGMDDFLIKPIQKEKLKKVLSQWVNPLPTNLPS